MKRRLAAILACALAVSTLAACGSDGANTTESSNTTSTGTSTTVGDATVALSVELVETEEDTPLHEIPVEDYVVLCDYEKLSISIPAKATYTDEEIDQTARESFGADLAYVSADAFATTGTVAEGDYVLIDYVGKMGGEAFDGGTSSDYVLEIGSDTFIDGFEDGLIGAKVGETVDVEVTFPDDYGYTEYAGKDAVFTITVKGMLQYNDAGVASLGYSSITNVDEYREAIVSMLEYEEESTYYENLTYAICDALVSGSIVTKIPSNIYEAEKEYVIEMVEEEAAYYGYDGDTYTYAYMGVGLADYAVAIAEEYAIQAVIFQAIANAEDLNATDEDVDAYVQDFLTYYGAYYGVTTAEDFYEYYTVDDVKVMIMQENVIDFITERATITETE